MELHVFHINRIIHIIVDMKDGTVTTAVQPTVRSKKINNFKATVTVNNQ